MARQMLVVWQMGWSLSVNLRCSGGQRVESNVSRFTYQSILSLALFGRTLTARRREGTYCIQSPSNNALHNSKCQNRLGLHWANLCGAPKPSPSTASSADPELAQTTMSLRRQSASDEEASASDEEFLSDSEASETEEQQGDPDQHFCRHMACQFNQSSHFHTAICNFCNGGNYCNKLHTSAVTEKQSASMRFTSRCFSVDAQPFNDNGITRTGKL